MREGDTVLCETMNQSWRGVLVTAGWFISTVRVNDPESGTDVDLAVMSDRIWPA